MNTSELEGRIALVTGASSGLGFASARALARRGAKLAVSSRGGEKLDRAVDRLAGEGHEVLAHPADVRDPQALGDLVRAVRSRMGPIDILVANGGGPSVKPASELDEDDWEQAIPLTLLFIPRLCRLVLPEMRRRRWGRILAINSVSSRQPIPGLALSNTLRPAVLGYLKTLSDEVASAGVMVNAVLPGYTRTERQIELAESVAARTGKTPEQIFAEQSARAPLGRMGEPDEIGETIAFLASPKASYITGQAITVDGGYVRGLL